MHECSGSSVEALRESSQMVLGACTKSKGYRKCTLALLLQVVLLLFGSSVGHSDNIFSFGNCEKKNWEINKGNILCLSPRLTARLYSYNY